MPFLTNHGTFIAQDGMGRLMHRTADGLVEGETWVELDEPPTNLRQGFAELIAFNVSPRVFTPKSGPLAQCDLEVVTDKESLKIRRDGKLLHADPKSQSLAFEGDDIGDGNSFAYFTPDDFEDLRELLARDWIMRSTQQVVQKSEISLRPDFQLQVGEKRADLRDNLPFVSRRFSSPMSDTPVPRMRSVTLLIEGWRVEELVLYRPMVFATVFKSPRILRESQLCIESLTDVGCYRGAIHVITDQSREDVLRAHPWANPNNLSVQTLVATDWFGYVMAKFAIKDWPQAHGFQPLLFVDPDIIFDTDVEQMLVAVALADRVCAPVEGFSPLETSESMGARLFQQDGHPVGQACGINAGTLGFQSLIANADLFETVRAVFGGFLRWVGRKPGNWADQPIVNYIGFKLNLLDWQTLTPFVHHGAASAWHNLDRPRGLVHFWPEGRGDARGLAMAHYLAEIRRRRIRATSDSATVRLGNSTSRPPENWPMPHWQAALARANAGQGMARILMLGDSTTYGYGAQGSSGQLRTPLSTPAQLATLLTAGFGLTTKAESWMGLSLPEGDPRISLGGGWTVVDSSCSLGGPSIMATSTDGILRFNPSVPANSFVLYVVRRPGGGILTVRFNDGQVHHVVIGGEAGIGAHHFDLDAYHDNIEISATQIGSGLNVIGCEAYGRNSDQITIVNAGWHGGNSSQISDTTSAWSSGSAIADLRADLTIINVGINDWHQSTSLDDFRTNINNLVTAAKLTGDVLLCLPNSTHLDSTSRTIQEGYCDQLTRVAATQGINLVNIFDLSRDWSPDNEAKMMNDAAHPSARGYQAMAQLIAPLLIRLPASPPVS